MLLPGLFTARIAICEVLHSRTYITNKESTKTLVYLIYHHVFLCFLSTKTMSTAHSTQSDPTDDEPQEDINELMEEYDELTRTDLLEVSE